MKQKNFYFYTNILAWGLVLFLIGNYVFGWTTPTANPPSSNLSAPVNVSSTEQTKTGNLIIDSLLKVGRYSSAPSGSVGTLYFDTTDDEFKGYKSTGWDSIAGGLWTQSGSDIYYNTGNIGIGATDPGSAKLKISGGVLDMTSQKITSLATPTNDTDAATKGYVDAAGATCEHIARHSASQHYGNHNCDDNPINCCPTGYHMCSIYEVQYLVWIGCLDTANLDYSGDDVDSGDVDNYSSTTTNTCSSWTSNTTSSTTYRPWLDLDFSTAANYGVYHDWNYGREGGRCDDDEPVWCCS